MEVEGLLLRREGGGKRVRKRRRGGAFGGRGRGSRREKKKPKKLTVTASATSSAIASSSRCTPSAAELSLLREARTAETLRETSASAARLRSSAAAPARDAAEEIRRSATAGVRAGAIDEVDGLFSSSPPAAPPVLLTRAHRTSVESDSTSVAQSASIEAGVRSALMGRQDGLKRERGRSDGRKKLRRPRF